MRDRNRLIVDNYNFNNRRNPVESIENIPDDILKMYSHLDYADLAKPFILMWLHDGVSIPSIQLKINLTYDEIRGIAKKKGLRK